MRKIVLLIFILNAITLFSQNQPVMTFVKGGTFKMGNPYTDRLNKGDADERPVHEVKVSDFYIGTYEITVAQFKDYLRDNSYHVFDKFGVLHSLPSAPDSTWWQGHPDCKRYWDTQLGSWWGWKSNFPMFHVTWFDAISYCNWLSIESGLQPCYKINKSSGIVCDFSKNGYRLPTEAEWEYAASGGTKTHKYRFSGSNNFNDVAWVDDNTFLSGPKTVGTKKSNELGIYDMSGNVWEWCTDYYSPYYYKHSNKENPICKQYTGYRSLRGGSWHYRVGYATIYTRDGPKAGFTDYNYGFRVVRKK